MMAKSAITEESCQHGQGACREGLIDERFLPLERFDRGATGQRIFAGSRIGNFRIEFTDRPQAFSLASIPSIEGLAENELSARR
ncbi:MAG TPA: hypothetical protein VFI05_01695, partial [Nitrospiraceae bacterium]|nr:hypothetical protein [Nitrospiraceae bacterium]